MNLKFFLFQFNFKPLVTVTPKISDISDIMIYDIGEAEKNSKWKLINTSIYVDKRKAREIQLVQLL